jgi:hypothetical protein
MAYATITPPEVEDNGLVNKSLCREQFKATNVNLDRGEERAKPGKAYDAYKHTISGTSDGAWCLDDIAPDTPLMGKRAGELIARSAITRFANTLATEALREIRHDVPR